MRQLGIAVTFGTLAVAALSATGCTSTDHIVANRGDLLAQPRQTQTLGEALQRAQQEGCLRAGSSGDLRCNRRLDEWAEVLAPPQLPEAEEPSAPPPPPPASPPPEPEPR
ncbi:hypothetical protein [Aurantiacibacter zhengii]|uniref:hypothetical protein n=1 Tax=Aurantiacibacter zhengii TaxID=2307003 RepID=UPI001314537D|nr:hypothetical protein [Aurantiacibacter zhengii]